MVSVDTLYHHRAHQGHPSRGKTSGVPERELAARTMAVAPEPDEYFHEEFVRALFDHAVRAVRAEHEASGRSTQFSVFEAYDLSPDEGVS